jgi:hypothetical protein
VVAFAGQREAMQEVRFSEEQILRRVREASAGRVAKATKHHVIWVQTIYRWRKQFDQFGFYVLPGATATPAGGTRG